MLSSLLSVLYAQTAEPLDWGKWLLSVGASIPIGGVLMWRLQLADRETARKDEANAKEIARKDEAHAREVAALREEIRQKDAKLLELVQQMYPALIQSTGAITDLKTAVDPSGRELNLILRELRGLTEELQRGGNARERERRQQ